MGLRFYKKAILVCLIGFSVACERVNHTPAVGSDSNGEMSRSPNEVPFSSGDSAGHGQSADSMSGSDIFSDNNGASPLTPQMEKELIESHPDDSSPKNKVKKTPSIIVSADGPESDINPSPPTDKIIVAQRGDNDPVDVKKPDLLPPVDKQNVDKPLIFPQKKSWRFSLEQISNFDFLEGEGSDYFHYYLQFWINEARNFVPQIQTPHLQESWSSLCYESDCLNGIDPKQIGRFGIQLVIKNLSFLFSNSVYIDEDGSIEDVFFLQGQLAPIGWDRWFYIKNQFTALPPHIKEIEDYIKVAEQQGIRRMAVNLPFQFHKDPEPFILLGKFLKRQGIDLYIMGSCGHYCATYLLPAAKTVYIEPYGYIYYTPSFFGLNIDIQKAFQKERVKYVQQLKKNWLTHLTHEERVDFVIKTMRPPITPPGKLKKVIALFKGELEGTRFKKAEEFKEKLINFQRKLGKLSVTEWIDLELREFVRSFSSELLEEVALFFKLEITDTYVRAVDYLERLQAFSKMEKDYYSERGIHVNSLDTKASQKKYNYGALITLFDFLLKDPEYEKLFSVPRPYYNVPEKDKPYEWIVPSAELLRSVGIDIRGENNIEMLDFSEFSLLSNENKNIKEKILFLDSAAIENCGFVLATSYTTEKLKECLKESIPKEAHSLFEGPPLYVDTLISDSAEFETGRGSASDETLSEDFNFPQRKKWNVTLEQVANFDFIKNKGSDLFHYYLQLWFNELNFFLNRQKITSHFRRELSKFCYESDCSKGIDPQQLSEFTISSLIRHLSFLTPATVYPDEKDDINPNARAVYFLTSQLLSPAKWNPWLYYIKNKNTMQPGHEKLMVEDTYIMKQYNIRKIAVNLPPQPHKDPIPFMLLGKFIKQQGIDLHIVGGCEHYCATYLLPAARTVYIEPYGYIYHKGIAAGLLEETGRAIQAQKEMYAIQLEKEWPEMTSESRIDFIVNEIMKENDIVNTEQTVTALLKFLQENDSEKLKEFRDKLSKTGFKVDKLSYTDWEEKHMKVFVESLSPELLKTVALFLKMPPNDKLQESFEYVRELNYFSQMDRGYYGTINIQEGKSNYPKLLLLSSYLLKDHQYAEIFSVQKPYYSIPEEDKPYEWVVPSAELLRSFGINIKGENNMEMVNDPEFLSLLGITRESILYLDSKGIENCKFFEKEADAAYTTEKIKECLAQE